MKRLTRRDFLQTAAAMPLAIRQTLAQVHRPVTTELLLLGTQTSTTSKGIYAYRFNSATGTLQQIGLAAETPAPTFLTLTPDGSKVLAVHETSTYNGRPGGSLSSFYLDRKTMRLSPIQQVASRGAGPCHIAVDATGRCVFVANYGGGSIASYRLAHDGTLSEAVSFLQYNGSGPNKLRQQAPHAHRVTLSPDNRFLLVNDLGVDQIHSYRLDPATAILTPNDSGTWTAPPGSGPRALQFHPNGKWVYCVTEIDSAVILLHWNAANGTLRMMQQTHLLPGGYTGITGASDIVLDREGKFAYAANRLNDFVVTFAVSQKDGSLTLIDRSSCGGKTPRHLALDQTGRWLLFADQDSDTIAVIARNPNTGKLAKEIGHSPLPRPQCILFV